MCFKGASIVGPAALSGVGQIFGGIAGSQAEKANAQMAKREGQMAQTRSTIERGEIAKRQRELSGAQQVAVAKGGRAFGGSALDVITKSNVLAEEDILASTYGANVASTRAKYNAQLAKARGRNALIGGFAGGGSTLLTGVVKAYG